MSQKRKRMTWDLTAPAESKLKDQDVNTLSQALAGKRICLLICGSIAAYKAPDIIRTLRRHSATVFPVASNSALQFVTSMALEWTSGNKAVTSLTTDTEHLGSDTSFDIYLLAPATYNTINKAATGIADSTVSITLSSSLGLLESGKCRVLMAPCMHGSMHNSILTESMKKLQLMGVEFIKPKQEDGKNKLPEPEDLVNAVIKAVNN